MPHRPWHPYSLSGQAVIWAPWSQPAPEKISFGPWWHIWTPSALKFHATHLHGFLEETVEDMKPARSLKPSNNTACWDLERVHIKSGRIRVRSLEEKLRDIEGHPVKKSCITNPLVGLENICTGNMDCDISESKSDTENSDSECDRILWVLLFHLYFPVYDLTKVTELKFYV